MQSVPANEWQSVPSTSAAHLVGEVPSEPQRDYHGYSAANAYSSNEQQEPTATTFIPLNDEQEVNPNQPYRQEPQDAPEDEEREVYQYNEKEGLLAPKTFDDDPIGYVKQNPKTFGAMGLAFLVAAALVLGICLGTILPNRGAVKARFGNWHPPSSSPYGSGDDSDSSGSGSSGSSGVPPPPRPPEVQPLPFWDVTDPNNKILGVSLGNWLILEKWMDNDWFSSYAPDAQDEWTFIETLGTEHAESVLDDHWSTWIQEGDLDVMQSHGINHVRIPIGFWLFGPVEGEPYINTTQLVHLDNMLGWLYKRNMRTIIDLHGMPGSQNSDQSSGHIIYPPQWFSQHNQWRSINIIKNLIQWIQGNTYQSVITGVSPVNEPVGVSHATPERFQITQDFYEQTYSLLKDAGIPLFWHHAFHSNPTEFWRPFAQGKDPRYCVMNDNPYPGDYPPQTNVSLINSRVCSNMDNYLDFPVPSVKTEWSLGSGINDNDWLKQFYATQASAYGQTAGWFFWSWRTENVPQFSFETLSQMGVIPSNMTGASKEYLEAMPNPACGPMRDVTYNVPSAAPTPTVSTESAGPSPTASYAGTRRH